MDLTIASDDTFPSSFPVVPQCVASFTLDSTSCVADASGSQDSCTCSLSNKTSLSDDSNNDSPSAILFIANSYNVKNSCDLMTDIDAFFCYKCNDCMRI